MELPVKLLTTGAKLPTYAHPTDAGMDLYALESLIKAGELVNQNWYPLAVRCYVGLVWDKSGLVTKTGITTLAGVIDAGYRGKY